MENPSQIPRRGGRPARISREQIISEALELLVTEGFDAFSMPRLGRRMDVSSMALYKHFPGRDAILAAVTCKIIAHFSFDGMQEEWDSALSLWFKRLFDLFERYPILVQLAKLEGQQKSQAWLKIWAPLALILHKRGLRRNRLSFAMDWIIASAMGLVAANSSPKWHVRKTFFSKPSGIESVDAVLAEVDQHYMDHEKRMILDFGAMSIVESIERHFRDESADHLLPK